MKKILPLALAIVFSCSISAQELLDEWTLHYMIIDGTTIDVPQPGPPNILYHTKIEFYESSSGYEASASISPDNNYFFESNPPMLIGTDTFTFNFGSVTLGQCDFYCDIEANYFGTILGGANRTFDYEITTAGNGYRTLVITSPDGDIAVHGDFILSNPDNEQARISLFPNPVKNELQLSAQGITVADVIIFSIEGRQISDAPLSESTTLDVSHLSSGLYFLKITDIEGKGYVHKFLKQ